MLISVIGQLKILKFKSQSGFSLFEIIIVISLISVLSYFISLSPFFISKDKTVTSLDEKINLIQSEIVFLQRQALSINSYIRLNVDNQFNSMGIDALNKNSFKDCKSIDQKINYFYVLPSAKTSEILINCKIMNMNYELIIDNLGNVKFNG